MLSTDFSFSDLQFMLAGAWVSLQLTLWAMLIGTLSGAVFGLVRAVYPRASAPLGWLLDVFRCVPLLIQFVLFNSFNSIAGINWTAFAIGCLVLGIYCASYCTEVIRGGVLAVPPNVVRAARSLGLSYTQTLRYIIMPMAARVSFPGLRSQETAVRSRRRRWLPGTGSQCPSKERERKKLFFTYFFTSFFLGKKLFGEYF